MVGGKQRFPEIDKRQTPGWPRGEGAGWRKASRRQGRTSFQSLPFAGWERESFEFRLPSAILLDPATRGH